MTDTLEQRRAKEKTRRVSRTGATALMPVGEWWPDIPWYPGSVLAHDDISVTEYFEGRRSRVEAMSLTNRDTVEEVTGWYLEEMQRLGWLFLPADSRVTCKSAPDHRKLLFTTTTEQVQVEVQIWELGVYPAVPAQATPDTRHFVDLLRQKFVELDQQAAERAGGEVKTGIFLARTAIGIVP